MLVILYCTSLQLYLDAEVCHKISQTKNSENGNGPVKGISRISAWRLSALHDTRTPRTRLRHCRGYKDIMEQRIEFKKPFY